MNIDAQLYFRPEGTARFASTSQVKKAKYGIKVLALVSASNFYTSNLEVYVGVQPNGPFKNSNERNELVKLRSNETLSGSKIKKHNSIRLVGFLVSCTHPS